MNKVKMVDPITSNRKLKEHDSEIVEYLYPEQENGDPNECEEASLKELIFNKNEGVRQG